MPQTIVASGAIDEAFVSLVFEAYSKTDDPDYQFSQRLKTKMCTRVLLLVIVFNFITVLGKRKDVEEERNVAKKPASTLVRPYVVSPKDTWQAFLKNAELEDNRHKKRRLRNRRLRQMPRGGLPGPRGPRGPPGPPGGHVTKEELVREFREMVREAAERRIQLAVDPQCMKEYTDVEKSKTSGQFLPPLFDIDHVTITPKVTWSFLWQLKNDVWINSNSMIEISNYYKPFALGSHDRCQSFVTSDDSYNCQNDSSLNVGKYQVPKSGFYTFYVSFRFNKNSSCEMRPFDSIEVLLCVNSQCEENVSLRTITNLKNSTFTVSINGILHLKKKQYASVYVDNNSRCSVKILRNSQIAGFLTGY